MNPLLILGVGVGGFFLFKALKPDAAGAPGTSALPPPRSAGDKVADRFTQRDMRGMASYCAPCGYGDATQTAASMVPLAIGAAAIYMLTRGKR